MPTTLFCIFKKSNFAELHLLLLPKVDLQKFVSRLLVKNVGSIFNC